MHIGVITGEYPPMEGGVGDFTKELTEALDDLGHKIDILTSASTSHMSHASPHIKVIRRIRQWTVPAAFPVINRWLRETQPDIINIQYQAAAYQMKGGINFLPMWLKKMHRLPSVITFHDLLPPYLFPKAGPIREWSVRYLARTASGVIVTNEEDRQQLVNSLASGCPPLQVIPIGSNIATQPPANFNPLDWRLKYGVSESELLIGFFGFLHRSKGVDILLSAIAQLREQGVPVKLLFIGGRTGTSDDTNQSYADYIDSMVIDHELQESVLSTGFVPVEEVSAALLSLDICTLPYLEGASFRHGTLHAALSHGCAIITTQPLIATPQLENGSVYLIPPNDVTALVDAIMDLHQNAPYRQKLKKSAQALSKLFTWEHIASQTISFFEALTTQA